MNSLRKRLSIKIVLLIMLSLNSRMEETKRSLGIQWLTKRERLKKQIFHPLNNIWSTKLRDCITLKANKNHSELL
jgi:hypothetical protein